MMIDQLARVRAYRLMSRKKANRAPCTKCSDAVTAAADGDVEIHGLAVPYDLATGDGRMVRGGALTWNLQEEGVPIIWDRQDGDHTGMVLGRVDALRADDAGVWVDGARLFATEDP